MIPFKFHEKAHFEFIESYYWYEFRQQGLGERFMNSVQKRLDQISEQPNFFSKKHKNFREAKVEDFPFTIVYEYLEKQKLIHVAAIYHAKRHPRKKFRRMK